MVTSDAAHTQPSSRLRPRPLTAESAPSESSAAAIPGLFPLASLVVVLRFSAAMAWLLATAALPRSAFFRVQEIAVSGTRQLSVQTIVAQAGVRAGDPLFAVPAGDVAARVRRIPQVAWAQVAVAPTGRVQISITERTPLAAIPYRDAFVVIDSHGVAFEQRASAAGLPIITQEDTLPWVRLGDRVPSTALRHVLQVLPDLLAGIAGPGSTLRMAATGEFTLITPGGITVLLGQRQGLAERAATLPRIIEAVRSRQLSVQYLDVRFAGNVVIRPAGAPTSGAGVRP